MPAHRMSCCALAGASLLAWTAQAACTDPLKEPDRYKASAVELLDSKTQLVWFRCAALFLPKENRCDTASPLPAQTWAAAVEPPAWLPKRRTPWRIASVEELDTISAQGCGYLVHPRVIEIAFDAVWTRTEDADGKVVQYGVDRRKTSISKTPEGDSGLAQSLYVRNAQ